MLEGTKQSNFFTYHRLGPPKQRILCISDRTFWTGHRRVARGTYTEQHMPISRFGNNNGTHRGAHVSSCAHLGRN
jgi:hypothetical protein